MGNDDYSDVRGMYDLIKRVKKTLGDSLKEALELGDTDQVKKLLKETGYSLAFAENQAVKRTYRILNEIHKGLGPESQKAIGRVFAEQLSNLELSIAQSDSLLQHWDEDIDRYLEEPGADE